MNASAGTLARATTGRVRKADVVVIGGGLAGLCAATVAAKEGLKVVVVRRGLGATAMSSGGLDFPDEPPRLFGTGFAGATAGGQVPAPDLPVLGLSAAPDPPALDLSPAEVAARLREWFAAAGADLVGEPGDVLPLMDVSGNVRRTNLAPAQHAAGRVDHWREGRVLFLAVDGYAAFRPEWVLRLAVSAGLVRPDRAAAASVGVPGLEHEVNLPAVRIARALEEPGAAMRFAAAVAEAARRAGASLVALPPVLGLDRADEVYRTVSLTVNEALPSQRVTVFELLSPPPSLPGQRLQAMLERVAEEAGVELVWGRAVGPISRPDGVAPGAGGTGPGPGGVTPGPGGVTPGRPGGATAPEELTAVTIESHGRTWTLEAAEFILATGKYAAGGLRAEGGVLSESVFGLTVFAPPPPGWPPGEVPAGRRPVREMVWEPFAARHPVFEAGLAVDPELRPLDGRGRVVFANLRAAGSVLGGPSHFADGAGAGVAVVTGVAAGTLAAAAVARREGAGATRAESAAAVDAGATATTRAETAAAAGEGSDSA